MSELSVFCNQLYQQLGQQPSPQENAQQMAVAALFAADLELRKAQLSRLLSCWKENHLEVDCQRLELSRTDAGKV